MGRTRDLIGRRFFSSPPLATERERRPRNTSLLDNTGRSIPREARFDLEQVSTLVLAAGDCGTLEGESSSIGDRLRVLPAYIC